MKITVSAGSAPVAGAVVTLLKSGDFTLRGTTDGGGVATFRFIPRGAAPLHVGVQADSIIGARLDVLPQ